MDTELFGELLAEIEQIPAIDIHTHIRADSPAASDLSEVMLYHYIKTELESAGVKPEIFESEGAKKRVAEAAKFMPRIANTTTYWCLSRILADLYGAGAPAECDIEELCGKVEQARSSATWASDALKRAGVEKAFVTCEWHRPLPKTSDEFLPTLRIDSLINEAHMPRTLDRLTEITEQTVYEVAELKKAIAQLFRQAKEAGCVAVAASFEPNVDFEEGSRDAADRILSLVLLGQKTNREDRKAIRSYVMDLVLSACAEHGLTFQLMLGVRRTRGNGSAITAFEPTMLSMYADLFARSAGVRFDVMTASALLAHELAVISRNYRNVYLSGYWWFAMFPEHIRKMIRERVQMLPMTKSCGFFSDAYCVEWIYGKSKLVRRELAFALAQMVEEGYLDKGTAVETARHYLWENPRRVYRLGES